MNAGLGTRERDEGEGRQASLWWQGLFTAALRRGFSVHMKVHSAPPASVLHSFLSCPSVPGAPSPPRAELYTN